MEDQEQKQEQQQQQQTEESRAAERIRQLFGEKKAAEERIVELEQTVEELRAQLLQQQQQQQQQLSSQYSTMPSPDIKQAVQEAVKPVVEELKQFQMEQVLREAQRASFLRAQQEFPELRDPSSPLYKLTDQLLTSRPLLQQDPDGPLQAALMARGLLAGELGAASAEKQAAGMVSGSEGPAVQPPEQREPTLDDLRKQHQELLQRLREVSDPIEQRTLWIQARRLQMEIAQKEEEQMKGG